MESIFSNINANLMHRGHLTSDCIVTRDCHEVTSDQIISDNDEIQEASMHPHDEIQEASMQPHKIFR